MKGFGGRAELSIDLGLGLFWTGTSSFSVG